MTPFDVMHTPVGLDTDACSFFWNSVTFELCVKSWMSLYVCSKAFNLDASDSLGIYTVVDVF